MSENTVPEEQPDNPPSKSARKREMRELQALGERLTGLSEALLAEIPLDTALREAIDTTRRINSREALRRQYQYIGKLMRKTDSDAIREAVERIDAGRKQQARDFHKLEQWRDLLLNEGEAAVDGALEHFPGAERQKLRQLLRQARKEREQDKPPASSRKLFRYLRELAGG